MHRVFVALCVVGAARFRNLLLTSFVWVACPVWVQAAVLLARAAQGTEGECVFEDEGVPFLRDRSGSGKSTWGTRLRRFADEKLPMSRTAAVGVCVLAVFVAVGLAATSFASSGVVITPPEEAGLVAAEANEGSSQGGGQGAVAQSQSGDNMGSTTASGAAEQLAADASGAGQQTETSGSLYVHVVGAVRNPGVYQLTAGSRAADAIDAAGGLKASAADQAVNLAQLLQDGQQLLVPTKKQVQAGSAASSGASDASVGSGVDSSSGARSDASAPAAKVNINTATSEQLQQVNGIGPATAEKIVQDREANGPFASVDDITRVSGIGEKKLEAMRSSITVG